MPIQPPPFFPKPPFKPLREVLTWKVSGFVIDTYDNPVADVAIRFTNKETNAVTTSTTTDAAGWFTALVQSNDAGYRVKPYKFPYVFCPGYSDIYGNMDLRFSCFAVNK